MLEADDIGVKCLEPILVSQISVPVTSNVNVCENHLLLIMLRKIVKISKMTT